MRSPVFMVKTRIILVYTSSLIKLTFLIIVYCIAAATVYLRDILLISIVVKPELRVLGVYLKSAFVILNLRSLKMFMSAVNKKDKDDSLGVIRIPRASDCRIIRVERIKNLQAAIIGKLFAVWFGIVCSSDDLKVLSAFGNTSWLTQNLLFASGIGKKSAVSLNEENRRRIQTVYRPYVSSLALYLKLEEGLRNGSAELPDLSITAKIKSLFTRSHSERVVTKNMYPRDIEVQRLEIKRENILSYSIEAVGQIKMNSEYMGFSKYLKAQSLIMEGRIHDRDKAEKLMNKLESLH
jgi:hypothetical protein